MAFGGASSETADGSFAGTPLYMAPEQAENLKGADTRSDVYSFGAAFYHAATGRPPFEDENIFALYYRHKNEPVAAVRSTRKELPPVIADVIERCLAKAPADRFQSFGEILDVLEGTNADPWDVGRDPLTEDYLERYRQARASLLDGPRAAPLALTFPSGSVFTIRYGDLVRGECDAIVSSDDMMLSMGGGVSRAILAAGGPAIGAEARKFTPVRHGGVVVTGGGNLRCRFVFHAVTIEFQPKRPLLPTRDIILQLLAGCRYHADALPVASLALPLLGTGAGGLSRDVCLDTIAGYFVREMAHATTRLKRVDLVLRPGG